jgi:hypothetical protein
MTPISTERTLGHSPKVVWPGLAVTAFGAGLLVLGITTDSRMLRAVGVGALASSLLAAPLGYAAPPGAVVPPDHDVRDSHDHESARHVTQYEPATADPEATPTLSAN